MAIGMHMDTVGTSAAAVSDVEPSDYRAASNAASSFSESSYSSQE